MTHRITQNIHPGTGPDDDRHSRTNAVAVVGLHAGFTALLLVVTLQIGLPLLAAAGLAWLGGACATVPLLLAHDGIARRDPLTLRTPAPRHAATAPDL